MPWEADGDGIRFSGHLTDLMSLIIDAYETDSAAGVITAPPGVYVTATAIVLREILLDTLVDQPEAAEFLARVGDALEENESGAVRIQSLAVLDDIAEHIEDVAWQQWVAEPSVRAAIAEVAGNTFSE